jgi:CDP-diacylglycerol---serine O-phosphatidyltransferase
VRVGVMATKPRKRRYFFRNKKRSLDGEEVFGLPPRKRLHVQRMKKGIIILPSLLTLTAIFFSFYAIICAVKESRFVASAILIIISGFFDGIDGRVARLTKTTTRFGLELDSLADVISFGVAPALLMYMWALQPYDQVGWVTAFVFVSCGALRLARFNVQSGVIDPKRFNGLPIPAAAAMVAATVLFFHKAGLDPADFGTVLLVTTYVLSFFMVSSIKFHGFKDLAVVKEKPFSSTVAFVLMLALIAASPFVVPFFLCLGYLISGPILTVMLYRRNRNRPPEPQTEEPVISPVNPSAS